MLANQGGLEPFFDQPLARPRDRVDTALQRRRDLAVAPALTTVRGVGFQQDPGLQQLLCWMVSAMDKGGEMLSLLIAQCHYVFLYRDLFPGHQSAPSAATEPSSQTNAAESMTEATRTRGRSSGLYKPRRQAGRSLYPSSIHRDCLRLRREPGDRDPWAALRVRTSDPRFGGSESVGPPATTGRAGVFCRSRNSEARAR